MTLARILTLWVVLAIAMSANGVARELGLRRLLRPAAADAGSAAIGAAILLVITWFGFRHLAPEPTPSLLRASILLVALTVAFEFLFGHYGGHKSWRELVANYAFWRGRLWPFLLLLVALSPFLWNRWLRAGTALAPA